MKSVYPNLCKKLDDADISISRLARELNISESETYDKLGGVTPWLLSDAIIICQLLHTSDINFLFLQLV